MPASHPGWFCQSYQTEIFLHCLSNQQVLGGCAEWEAYQNKAPDPVFIAAKITLTARLELCVLYGAKS